MPCAIQYYWKDWWAQSSFGRAKSFLMLTQESLSVTATPTTHFFMDKTDSFVIRLPSDC